MLFTFGLLYSPLDTALLLDLILVSPVSVLGLGLWLVALELGLVALDLGLGLVALGLGLALVAASETWSCLFSLGCLLVFCPIPY